ncbi:uncharacterized protein MONBRDRAFT_24999 [Monosiga brevicollis MX1]|uniref:B9 domain-containing protein 1 n=1 Tax=Monosiga brevicollis TaxID=81824 RepID=A9UXG9_MONBE|nr:uncharacterized protein MONBRDRAFT_24999 [Monosiga brevicollis MX1]EDQ89842.1 predicted protein [Monosiga brevicollis MX1]|eukprot:XP_001745264.1 hypothetical protein [Monosiga brevicollis MX1]
MLVVHGEVARIQYDGVSDLYCKYKLDFGTDWAMTAGLEEGLSQTSVHGQSDGDFVFNLPVEATFKSTNPFGWPQLVLSAYGSDFMGRDVVRGYGAVHLPTTAGRHQLRVPLFVPQDVSLLQRYIGILSGKRPEFVNSTIVAKSEGREVTRVTSHGSAIISIDVSLKDLHKFGYLNTSATSPMPSASS